MQTTINLVVSIFLGILALSCFVAIVMFLLVGLADEQDEAKMFGFGGITGIVGVLSAIVIYLMKTRGLF